MKTYTVQITRTIMVEHEVEAADEDSARELAEEWAYGECDWIDHINYADVVIEDVSEQEAAE
jgi:hypothetical protein